MCRRFARVLATAVVLLGLSAVPSLAQYNSGSSGIHGVFPPAPTPTGARYLLWDLKTGLVRFCSAYDTATRLDTCTTEISTAQIPGIQAGGLTTGVFEFSSVDVAAASSPAQLDIYPVGYDGPTPLTILVQTSFRLRTSVTLRLDGAPGMSTSTGLQPSGYMVFGGRPGPGGYGGGNGGRQGSPSTNGSPGFGPTGGAGGTANQPSTFLGNGSNATQTPVATSLIPLVGGSGGGGSGAHDTFCGFRGAGAGGGGGAGALLVAASAQITLDSFSNISALGGAGGASSCFPNSIFGVGGGGSSGSVRLVAPTITGGGGVVVGSGVSGGIVRIEGNTAGYTGGPSTTRGTVLGAPQPAIPATFPVLRITAVGGLVVSQSPSGAPSTPDVTFPTAPTSPVTVDLSASEIPPGTVVNLRAAPITGSATTASSSALAGTLQNSTATASLTIPPGAGVITAVTSFPVTTVFLERLPPIPGMTPATVEVLADASGASRVFVLSADARRVEVTMGPDGRYALVQ